MELVQIVVSAVLQCRAVPHSCQTSQPSKGSPLVWFADWFGASLYWIGFPILIIIIWVLLYVPIGIIQHIKQKSRSCS